MIVGLGLDLAEIDRFRQALVRCGDRIERRILTCAERAAVRGDRARYLASRFAAKEAAAKALGTGIGEAVSWHSLEVVSTDSGRPELRLRGTAAALAHARGVVAVHLSLTHTREHAAAVVVLDRDTDGPTRGPSPSQA